MYMFLFQPVEELKEFLALGQELVQALLQPLDMRMFEDATAWVVGLEPSSLRLLGSFAWRSHGWFE